MIKLTKDFTKNIQHLIDESRAYLIEDGMPSKTADEIDDISVIGYATAIRELLKRLADA